jgi:hypothetical protein
VLQGGVAEATLRSCAVLQPLAPQGMQHRTVVPPWRRAGVQPAAGPAPFAGPDTRLFPTKLTGRARVRARVRALVPSFFINEEIIKITDHLNRQNTRERKLLCMILMVMYLKI